MDEPGRILASAETPKRRWKLWHLTAIVAVAALIMAVFVHGPFELKFLATSSIIVGPPFWVATAWDGRIRRFLGMDQPHSIDSEGCFVKFVWFVLFLFAWGPFVITLILAILAYYQAARPGRDVFDD